MTVKVFVDGGHGTTGLEIVERLTGRAEFDLFVLDDDLRKDAAARRDALNAADVVFLCLPDDAAREAVSLIDNDHTRVIDASSAHRVAAGWMFGFYEFTTHGRELIEGARFVSNPGCYPTGFLALVAPLVRAGLIPADWPLSINAVSGYSGGGKAMIAEFEAGGTDTAWRTYGLSLAHKHVPEMQRHAGLVHAPIFAPSVARAYRGMVTEVPLSLAAMPGKPSIEALRDVLAAQYAGSTLINFIPDFEEATLRIEHAANTDRMDLFAFASADGSQVRLVAALDNLGKGASGAAVQTLNIFAGLDETAGLKL